MAHIVFVLKNQPRGWKKFFNDLLACNDLATLSLLVMPKINNVFVDGGCVNNGKPWARAGCVYIFLATCTHLVFAHTHIIIGLFAHRYCIHFDHISTGLLETFVPGPQTNNRAVMAGLVEALKVRLHLLLLLSSDSFSLADLLPSS